MLSLATHATVDSRELALPPEDGELAEMYARWQVMRGADPMPPRTAVTFETMLPMVGRINLIDVLPARAPDEAFHFALRLVSTAREMRAYPTYKTVRDIRPRRLAETVEADFERCVRLAAPTLSEVDIGDGLRMARFRRLLLPCAETPGGTTPSLLVACLVDGPGVREMMASPRFRDHAG